MAALLAAVAIALTGCTSLVGSGPATWVLAPGSDVSSQSRQLEIAVTRAECSSGRTGEVLAPDVVYQESRIVITARVAPLPPGGQNCPGNDSVRMSVELDEPIGQRELVDGACESGEVPVAMCDGSVRWSPA